MLEDYPIRKRSHYWIEIIQFIILLVVFQSMIFLLQEQEASPVTEDIQFRVIAHSNDVADQEEKQRVQEILMQEVQSIEELSETPTEFHREMHRVTPMLQAQIEQLVPTHPVRFEREQALIPPKRSGFYFQPQGQYDTYVVTIGSGRGDNWWCALFSNICYPKEEQEEQEEKEPVTFFIWEWIKGLFS